MINRDFTGSFPKKDIETMKAVRPELSDSQIENVLCFLCDQYSIGMIFKGTDSEIYGSAADFIYPAKKSHTA